jgi:RND family efflux transporter MFP subunit
MGDLHEKRSISDQEFDEVSTKAKMAAANHEMALSRQNQLAEKIQQAEQAVKAADLMRGYALITAPFDGVVTARMAEPGILAVPGAPLLTLEQDGVFRLEARVEESRLAQVRVGQEVEVVLDALSSTVSARVSEIVPEVDSSSRAFTVRIDLPRSASLRSGLFGRARFGAEAKQVVTVPAAALVTRGQIRLVYVVDDGRVRSRLVTVGERRDETFEVLSGLAAGERIVAPVPAVLLDGSPVEVRP